MKLDKRLSLAGLALLLACAAAPEARPTPQPSETANKDAAFDFAEGEAPKAAMAEKRAEDEFAAGAPAPLRAATAAKPAEPEQPGQSTPPAKPDVQGGKPAQLPGLLARISGPDQTNLPLVSQEVTVLTAGARARVLLDLVFANDTPQQLSGTLMISLPQGASPAGLLIYPDGPAAANLAEMLTLEGPTSGTVASVLDQLWAEDPRPAAVWQQNRQAVTWGEAQSAKVTGAVQARQVYEQTVRQRVDPALAEWTGGNTFSTRIFPLAPGKAKRVVFIYDRPLPTDCKLLSLELPALGGTGPSRLTVLMNGKTWLEPQLLSSTGPLPLMAIPAGFSLTKTWPKGTPAQALKLTAHDPGQKLITLAGKADGLPGTFVHALYRPRLEAKPADRSVKKAVILLDTSYSGRTSLYSLSGRLLKALLEGPAAPASFQLAGFDVQARGLTSGWQDNTPEVRQRLFKTLENTWLEGATNFQAALDWTLAQPDWQSAEGFFLLSDGQVNWGVDGVQALERSYAALWAKPWFAYTFGEEAVNLPLFESLTRAAGRIIPVQGEGGLTQAASAHTAGAMAFKGFQTEPGVEVLVAGNPSRLSAGQTLELAVRLPAGKTSTTLQVLADGFTDSLVIEAVVTPLTSPLASRSWAELYVQRLLSLNEPQADRGALALSQRFRLSNRVASLLILESGQDYTQAQIVEEETNLPALLRLAKARGQGRPAGALDLGQLPPETRSFVESLKPLDSRANQPWQLPAPVVAAALKTAAKPPRPSDKPADLYQQARSLLSTDPAAALRVLSTIIELNPGDDQGTRLTAFALLEWGLYEPAGDLFAKLRRKRPFEPQNHLWEALAQTSTGRLSEAAASLEMVLQGSFPRFSSYAQVAARVLYRDLLLKLQKAAAGQPALLTALGQRLKGLGDLPLPVQAEARIITFWNLDDTDLDLHVQEPGGEVVMYDHTSSQTGGQLYWDNTEGLGPELYSHPRIPQGGLKVQLNYYGSSSVEGQAPAAGLTLLLRTQQGQTKAEFLTTLLSGTEEKLYDVKLWK